MSAILSHQLVHHFIAAVIFIFVRFFEYWEWIWELFFKHLPRYFKDVNY